MRRNILLIMILIALYISGCQKLNIEKGTPVCIENLIKDFNKEQSCDNGVSVSKYTFQGNTVYVFDPGTCGADMTAEVIDFDCNSIGFLGGISGNVIINGENFSTATFESLVWER